MGSRWCLSYLLFTLPAVPCTLLSLEPFETEQTDPIWEAYTHNQRQAMTAWLRAAPPSSTPVKKTTEARCDGMDAREAVMRADFQNLNLKKAGPAFAGYMYSPKFEKCILGAPGTVFKQHRVSGDPVRLHLGQQPPTNRKDW